MRTGNPALNDKVFRKAGTVVATGEAMTLDGTVNKTIISILITMGVAWFTWSTPSLYVMSMPAVIIGFILALVISFKNSLAPMLTVPYAAVEGVFLGAISSYFETAYPGIVFQAVSLTFGTLFALLMLYKSKMIPVTQNFRLGILAATGGIAVVYLLSFIFSLFGMPFSFLHSSSPLSIGISVVVVIIAALNLVLDFDFIENAAESGNMPKHMEWYGAFGLLVTLIWLYVEILRLLAKINSRD